MSANDVMKTGDVIKNFKDQMIKFLLFQCDCNMLIELLKQIVLPKTA